MNTTGKTYKRQQIRSEFKKEKIATTIEEAILLATNGDLVRLKSEQGSAIVLTEERYKRLLDRHPSFLEYIMQAPSAFSKLQISRDENPMRGIKL